MDDTNRLTRGRLCLLVASLALNAFLLLKAILWLVSFVGAEYMSHVYVKTVVADRPIGLALVSLVEEALQGRGKREIMKKIESIYSAHPDISLGHTDVFWWFRYQGSDRAQGKDCIHYGGEYLVFWGEKFASFDADFKCTPDRYSYVFHGRNWSQVK